MEQYRGLGHALNTLMQKITLFAVISASIIGGAYAGSPLWGQCGGSGWTGATTCDVGVCTYLNYWYSQCLPATTTTTTTTTLTTPTSKTSSISTSVTCYTNLPTYTSIPIKASTPNTPVTGLRLGKQSDGRAVLGPYSIGPIILSGGTLYNQVSGPGCAYKYFLNVYNNANAPTSSYKDLKWENGVLVSDYWTSWGVTSASPWGAHNWFLACPASDAGQWLLYLQTGSDTPSGQNCTLTQLTQTP
ncbi:hypothetical protein FS837_003677 [Tulasnella sp. UAMH 9824]|nr:hypothetical protein FS837_003677 [Tulasnella sp. UAMH 9824]